MSNPERCDRCGKVIHGWMAEIGKVCLCNECYTYLEEQTHTKQQKMVRNARNQKEGKK